MTEELHLRRSVITLFPHFSAEAIVVLVYLVDRTYIQQGLGVGLSGAELARSCGIAATSVSRILNELEAQGLLTMVAYPRYIGVTLTNKVVDEGVEIPFTFKNTDETKLAVLENEVRRLRLQSERDRQGHASGLADVTEGEERDLYLEIERRGYGITVNEASLLGKCIVKFGVERTKTTYRQMRKQKNPILATYAALQKGIRGQGAKQVESKPFTEVRYRDL